ncbi:DUF943 family protein [Erwinia sp. PK3-005]
MKSDKTLRLILLLLALCAFGFGLYYALRKTEIVEAHIYPAGERLYSQHLVVKHFPLTDKAKISWWKRNAAMLKAHYGLEVNAASRYSVTVWDYDGGYEVYREGRFLEFSQPEHFCFEDMKTDKNCLDKSNIVMKIKMDSSGRINYNIDLKTYIEEQDGHMWVREWQ